MKSDIYGMKSDIKNMKSDIENIKTNIKDMHNSLTVFIESMKPIINYYNSIWKNDD